VRPTRPLFVTRKFPPSVGGMQTLAAGVWRALERRAPDARLISHGGSNRQLPTWLAGALPRVAAAAARRSADGVLTGDALMYALCYPIIRASGLPSATMIMGLDVTYPNPIYRAIVIPPLRRAPRVIAISRATADAAAAAGVSEERLAVVRLGIEAPDVGPADRRQASDALRSRLDVPSDHVVLLTIGRLVRRKGISWFLRRVLPRLPGNVSYVVAGDGPQAAELEATVRELSLETRVRTLGSVDDDDRELLLRGADIFVQPNVRVAGDMEGFGLVVLEAGVRGTPTVASGLEGILDAVVDGQTGILVPPEDADTWTEQLGRLIANRDELVDVGQRFGAEARQLYSEEQMGDQLLALLDARRATAVA
jgi:phosphatidylinositol alpha-1,6-mannosyltransferase